jgi:hypothetical protein
MVVVLKQLIIADVLSGANCQIIKLGLRRGGLKG